MVIAMDDLEAACPECNREGKVEGETCPKCDGKGVILTALGQTLLHFIKKHS
ncbi:tryptophan RNA-binding attenuation protein [Paenibacillus doosanensis]|uniref:Tryptophan RNA-binding attenuator protein inhibitory protein n=1 Tax=Paenibacillus konkukensis TaxID=2020716 RepID=A0ABY4RGQ4_9BACL|nr:MULTISPECIES: tryptophan RNA-binding attenuation protein [Paenibacillus]MCS7464113.1 tryptophan RNA-binding attenuation protein [Paenibacillus doosanensis]UQZ81330.1 Tryptophan RNA-binding attenuator protein inhibitory protein [Paenibacillus konkukensis]